jgi:hypothetical protein
MSKSYGKSYLSQLTFGDGDAKLHTGKRRKKEIKGNATN